MSVCRSRYNYHVTSKTGKVWKRKNEKRRIPCPLCPKSAQWIKRHIERVHKLSEADVRLILANSEGYKRLDKIDTNVQPRVSCPKCGMYVTRLTTHLKTAHIEFGIHNGIIPPSPVHPTIRIPLSGTSSEGTSAVDTSHHGQNDSQFLHSGDQSQLGNNNPFEDLFAPRGSQEFASASDVQCDKSVTDGNELTSNAFDSSDDDSQADLFSTSSDSNNSIADVCVDTNLLALIEEFKKHMAGVNGGAKARPETYSLAAKQILHLVGGDIAQLTKNNVYDKYVNPMLTQQSELSVKTIRSKLKHLEYFCKYLIEEKLQMLNDTGSSSAEITKVMNALPTWRQSLKKNALQRRLHGGCRMWLSKSIPRT